MIQKMRQCPAAGPRKEQSRGGGLRFEEFCPRGKGLLTNMLYDLWNNKIVSNNSILIRRYKCKTRSKVVYQFSQMKGLLLLLLVSMVSCLTTYSYPYYTMVGGVDIRPRIPISNLTVGDTITLEFNFFHQTGYAPTTYRILLLDSAFQTVTGVTNFDSSRLTIAFNTTTTYSFTAALTDYYISLSSSDSELSLQMFYLTITRNNAIVLTKHVDIIRSFDAFKVIYLNATKDITINTPASNILKPMITEPANFKLDSMIFPTNSTGNTKIYTSLPPGYYALILRSVFSAGTLSYQSDPYPCPFDAANYPDFYKSFDACTSPSSASSSSSQPPSEGLVAWKIAVIVVAVVLGIVLIVIVVLLLAKSSAASASTAGTVVPDSSGIVESVKPSNIAGIGMAVKE